jgi:uncharacterized ion transporter superfamily protein YfcC
MIKNGKDNGKISSKSINTFALLFLVIVVAGLLSYIIPAGAFDRMEVDGRTIIVPDSFHYTDTKPIGLFDVFRAIPNGMIQASNIMFLVLLVGGAIKVFNESGAINIGLARLVNKYGEGGGTAIIVVMMIFFAVLGGFLGWIEAAIPFVPLAMVVAIGLGYDTMVGVGICVLGGMLGFATGPTNLYTVGVAHEIAELPMFSGFAYRLIIYITFVALAISHVISYANKIKKDPTQSLMNGIDMSELKYDIDTYSDSEFTLAHKCLIFILVITLISIVYGMLRLNWSINDMSAAFVVSGIIAGIILRFSPAKIVETFIAGSKEAVSGAMVVGIARGVQWILNEGGITDTIIYSLSKPLAHLPAWLSAVGMFVVHTIINFFIPSGSGQAMATMPIMIPLSDLIGLKRQIATLAFQFGDGYSNIFWFSYGGLLIYLSYGKVPYDRWIKFIWPLIIKLTILSALFLIISVKMNYGPF